MNILIIGNGFDLAHNLQTTYIDFLKFIDAFNRFKDICKKRINLLFKDNDQTYQHHHKIQYLPRNA